MFFTPLPYYIMYDNDRFETGRPYYTEFKLDSWMGAYSLIIFKKLKD